MIPALKRVLRHGLLGGTDYRDLGISRSVINEQQMVHVRQGHDPLHECADHLASLKQAATTHTCSLAINARYALHWTVGLPAQS